MFKLTRHHREVLTTVETALFLILTYPGVDIPSQKLNSKDGCWKESKSSGFRADQRNWVQWNGCDFHRATAPAGRTGYSTAPNHESQSCYIHSTNVLKQ